MKKTLFAVAMLAVGSTMGQAADSLDPVLVTATRTVTTADKTTASVTVIDKDEIERMQALDVADLLRGQPGIDIGRNGGPGQPASIFIRGAESDHTLVLIDGVPINPGTLGNAAIQNINPSLVERIEIVRAPMSSLYGSAAIGGVINIITQAGADAPKGSRVTSQVGSDDTLNLSAGTRFRGGKARLSLDASHLQTSGFPSEASTSLDRGTRNDSLNGQLDYGDAWQGLRLQTMVSRGRTEYSSFGTPLDQDFDNSLFSVRSINTIRDDWQSTLILSRMSDQIDQNQANYLGEFDFAHTTRYTLDWQNDYQLGDSHLITAGLVLERENTDARSFGTSFDRSLDNQALYLQDQIEQGPHTTVAGLRLTHNESFGDNLVWNLGHSYQATATTRLRANIGTAYRAPSGTDLYGYGGNPSLQPEQSLSTDLGLEQRLDSHSSLEASLYYSRIRNLIVTNFYDLDGIDQFGDGWLIDDPLNENVARATILGAELSYRLRLAPWLLDAGVDWKQPKDQDNDVWLARRARFSAHSSLSYVTPGWDASLDIQHQGKRKDSLWNNTVLDAYTLAHATARFHLDRHLTLQARVENLTNTSYELAGGFNTPDRGYYLSIAIDDFD